jgi:cytochrome b561
MKNVANGSAQRHDGCIEPDANTLRRARAVFNEYKIKTPLPQAQVTACACERMTIQMIFWRMTEISCRAKWISCCAHAQRGHADTIHYKTIPAFSGAAGISARVAAFFAWVFPLMSLSFRSCFSRLFNCSVHYTAMHLTETAAATRSAAVSTSWSRLAIFFHWATALAVAIGLLAIEIRGPKGTGSRVFWTGIHMWAGTLVLCLSALRVLWMLWHGTPRELPASRVQRFVARLVHLALYLLVFAQPLLGIAMVNTSGSAVQLAGTGLRIQLFAKDPVAHQFLHDAHFLIGNAAFWLIGLHALAAIVHHTVFRDATLTRMLKVAKDT